MHPVLGADGMFVGVLRSCTVRGDPLVPSPVLTPASLPSHSGVLQARGASRVRKELLVGFAPTPLLLQLLESRFGMVGVFCADYIGGAVIAVKLKPAVLRAGALVAEQAHVMRPAVETPPVGAKRRGKRSAGGASKGKRRADGEEAGDVLKTEFDWEAVAADILSLGAGLVERVEWRGSVGKGA
jgi:hypothetical protein